MKAPLLILSIFIISACSNHMLVAPKNTTWDVTLQSLQGQTFENARTRLGTPETFYEQGNTTTYIWRQRTADSPNIPNTRTDWRPSRVSNDVVTVDGRFTTCTIKADTVQGVITRIWSEGTTGGCAFINAPNNHVSTITGIQ